MLLKVKQLFAPPIFEDETKTYQAKLLNTLVLAALISAILPALSIIMTFNQPLVGFIPLGLGLVLNISVLFLLRKKYFRSASILFIGGSWIILVYTALFFKGLDANVFNFLVINVLISGLLLGWQSGIALAGLTVITTLGLLYIELNNIVAKSLVITTPTYIWANRIVAFILLVVLVYRVTKNFNDRLEQTRNQSQQERQEQQDFVIQMMNTLGQGITMTDKEGRFAYVNPAYTKILGHPLESIIGKHPSEFIMPEDQPALMQAQSEWQAGKINAHELRIKQASGKVVLVSVTGVPRQKNGQVIGITRISTDLTERQQIEESLRANEALYKTIVENQTEFIARLNSERLLTFANDVYSHYFNQKSEEILGREFEEYFTKDDQQTFRKLLASLTQENPVETIEICSIIDEQIYWQKWINRAIFDGRGDLVEFLCVGYDITQHKQTEEALQKSEERFRQAITSISDHIYMTEVTANGHHINHYISPNVETLTGYPMEKFMADRYFWPNVVIHPDDRGKAADQSNRLDVGQHSQTEYRMIRADGEVIWVRDNARVEIRGNSKFFYGVVSDITEHKNLEEQLRQSQKMEAIGQLAGGIAHDFNNILTVIIGTSDLILFGIEKDSPLYKDAEQIQKAARQASSLTNQLLAFSRQQVIKPIVLNLDHVIRDSEKIFRRLISEDIDIITIPNPQLGYVKADPSQIEQIILNLAVNARDAMLHGGKLTIETKKVYLDETYTRQHIGVEVGPYIMLAVSDTGVGIDAKTQSRIFEPFFTTKAQGKGTGLGLATVHGIVKQSNGHIWLYSELGRGATFKIYFPEVEPGGEPILATSVYVNSQPASETILLVEDESMVRDLACRILSKKGYTVLEAKDGAEAIKISKEYKEQIDLLITDVVMPGGISGRQLAEYLVLQRSNLEVLYMSGYTDNAIVHHGVLSSGVAFIQKPFSPDTLAHKVRDVLEQ